MKRILMALALCMGHPYPLLSMEKKAEICSAKTRNFTFKYECFSPSLSKILKKKNSQDELIDLYNNLPESPPINWIRKDIYQISKEVPLEEYDKYEPKISSLKSSFTNNNSSSVSATYKDKTISLKANGQLFIEESENIEQYIKKSSPKLNQRLAFTLKMLELNQHEVINRTGLPRFGTELYILVEYLVLNFQDKKTMDFYSPFIKWLLRPENLLCNWPVEGFTYLKATNQLENELSILTAEKYDCLNEQTAQKIQSLLDVNVFKLKDQNGNNYLHYLIRNYANPHQLKRFENTLKKAPHLLFEKNKAEISPLVQLIAECRTNLYDLIKSDRLKLNIHSGIENVGKIAYENACLPIYSQNQNDSLIFDNKFAKGISKEKKIQFQLDTLLIFLRKQKSDYRITKSQMIKIESVLKEALDIEDYLYKTKRDEISKIILQKIELKKKDEVLAKKVLEFNKSIQEGTKSLPKFTIAFTDHLTQNLVRIRKEGDQLNYSEAKLDPLASSIAFRNNKLYLYGHSWLTLDDSGLLKPIIESCVKTWSCSTQDSELILDIRYADNHYFLSRTSKIEIYDKNFRLLSSINNPIPKAAHNIRIHDNKIFALDNLVYPTFVFVVDIKNISQPKVIEHFTRDLSSINNHLKDQWFDSNYWYILSSYAHMGGSGISIVKISLDNDTKKDKTYHLQNSRNYAFSRIVDREVPTFLIRIDKSKVTKSGSYYEEDCKQCLAPDKPLDIALAKPILMNEKLVLKNIRFLEMSPLLTHLKRPNEDIIDLRDKKYPRPNIIVDEKNIYLIEDQTGIQVNNKNTGSLLGFIPFERKDLYRVKNVPIY